MPMETGIKSYIEEQSRLIEGALYKEIPDQPPFIYGMIREFISRGGKRIRPVLTLAVAEAFGGKREDALPYAVAIELFHNFTLIHDDIEDSSLMRRGKPTLHAQFGIPIAINSGDALYTVVWHALLNKEIPPERLVGAFSRLLRGYALVVEGQGTELEWYHQKTFSISEEDYFRMATGKTGALMGVACEIGAYAAGASDADCLAMREFGEKLGLSFQIKDDVLNLTADPSKYKKRIGEDIEEGKRSLITIHLLSRLPERERKRVISILLKEKKPRREISEIIALAKKHGSIEYALSVSNRLIADAKSCLHAVRDEKKRAILESIADCLAIREK
ncbi:MAG: polyprenyl synthetase family protein [Candidatus Bilamarchaeaceae archaeon]